jgi:uncharacterized membrane protein
MNQTAHAAKRKIHKRNDTKGLTVQIVILLVFGLFMDSLSVVHVFFPSWGTIGDEVVAFSVGSLSIGLVCMFIGVTTRLAELEGLVTDLQAKQR